MGEWRSYRIGDLGGVVTGRTPPGTHAKYFGSSLPFLTPTDMDGRRRIGMTTRFLSDDGVELLRRVLVPHGVAVSCIGWQMGKAILVDRPVATNQQLNSIITNNALVDDLFLYYALVARRDEIFTLGAGGSRTPILNKSGLESFEVQLPELTEQRAIAHILGSLDDKIELNRRMNETLEAIARALFMSWFVDFDPVRAKAEGRDTGLPKDIADLFPDSFEDSELGEVPKGWGTEAFSDTIEIIGGGTPKTSISEYWDGDIPWFTVVDAPAMSDVWVVDTQKKITAKGVEKSAAQILPVGTTIISARGTVGRVAMVGVPMAMNQSCYALCGKAGMRGSFTYFATRDLVTGLKQRAHGSVFDTITRATLASVFVSSPPTSLVKQFESTVDPVLQRIRDAVIESRQLAQLRDTLLPKLIAGEVRPRVTDQRVEVA